MKTLKKDRTNQTRRLWIIPHAMTAILAAIHQQTKALESKGEVKGENFFRITRYLPVEFKVDGRQDRERLFAALSDDLQRFSEYNKCSLLDEGGH